MVAHSQWYVILRPPSAFHLLAHMSQTPPAVRQSVVFDITGISLRASASTGWGVETGARIPSPAHPASGHMTDDSSPKTPEARGASRADKNDELDANIRNFAPVARIMKNALPDNAKIAKEAKECMQECVSEFISFITSEGMSYTGSHVALATNHNTPKPLGAENASARIDRCPRPLTPSSLREVSAGEAENRQWRGHSVCDDVPRL